MRRAIVLLLVAASIQVVYGQGQKPHATSDKKNTQSAQDASAPLPAPTVTKIQQQTTPIQGDSTKENSKSYFGRLFAPENIPNIVLALVGIVGIIVAICTLRIIERQTKATEDAAKTAQDSVRIMALQTESAALDNRRLNRAYLTVDRWDATNLPAYAGNPRKVAIRFSIYNPSRTAARIDRLDYQIGNQPQSLSHGIILTPQERYEVQTPSMVVTKEDSIFTIRGKITYRDIFRRERHRTFSQSMKWNSNGFIFYQAEAPGMNDEEEWNKDD